MHLMPVPLREAACGLPGALSVTESLPVTLPVAFGVNLTLIRQLPPEARLPPQVLVSVKSAVAAMLLMISVAVP
jgi:hypothetical protein